MDMIPKVTQAVAGEGYIVYAHSHDGTVRRFDARPLIEQVGVFLPLQDEDFFRTHLTVLNDAVAWDMDGTRDPRTRIDLDPREMYGSCPMVDDPLRDSHSSREFGSA